MAAAAETANALFLKSGPYLENGVERTSTRVATPCSRRIRSISWKRALPWDSAPSSTTPGDPSSRHYVGQYGLGVVSRLIQYLFHEPCSVHIARLAKLTCELGPELLDLSSEVGRLDA